MAHGFQIGSGRCRSPGRQHLGVASYPLLQVAVEERHEGVVVVSLEGEVDMSTAGLLRRATHDAVETRPRTLVVELSGLTFCGSTGLVALMEARDHADRRGVGFGTAGGRPIMRRVLEITGFGPALRHCDTLEDALTAAAAG